VITFLFLLCALPVAADTITVDLNGAGDFLTIREGLDDAVSGDTVLVYPGTYVGPGNRGISLDGKAVVLRSRDGMDATILDMDHEALCSGFIFDDFESRDTIVDGFTVLRAVEEGGSSGFSCYYAWPTIRNCRFTDCWAYGDHHTDGWCAAGNVYSSGPLFENCVFDGNYAHSRCGGVCIGESSSAVFRNCVFSSNSDGWEGSGSIDVLLGSSATFEYCTFINHRAYGRVITVSSGSSVTLTNCTVVSNGEYVDALIGSMGATGTVVISNSIFAFNDCDTLVAEDAPVTITHSCLYETAADSLYSSTGRELNLRVDPRFCVLAGEDFTLCANSPCLPTNTGWEQMMGAYDEGCPPCDSPVESVSWSTIKALFR
jgi:hypothetical protein